jgi:hypothetical protein
MKVVIQPFVSQQSKDDFKFLLDADVTTQISRFLATKLKESGARVQLILPDSRDCHNFYPDWVNKFEVLPVSIPRTNKNQRLYFDPVWMLAALNNADLFITHNELTAWKVRQIEPKQKIIHFNHLIPIGDWKWMQPMQIASWGAADLIVFLAENLRRFAQTRLITAGFTNELAKTTVWPMVYDREGLETRMPEDPATTDILFVQRCSQNNYTHHLEFIQAIQILREQMSWTGTVTFTDPTHYLEMTASPEVKQWARFAHADTRYEYARLLRTSKIAVAMMTDDLHGGVAIREAIVTGCIPVLLDEPCYRVMINPHASAWPYMISRPMKTLDIAVVLRDALLKQEQWHERTDLNRTLGHIQGKVMLESYQAAWPNVEEDIKRLVEVNQ